MSARDNSESLMNYFKHAVLAECFHTQIKRLKCVLHFL